MSGNVEKLMKPGSSFEHVARWLTFCGAQPPFCNVSEKIPSQNSGDNSAQLGVSVFVIKEKPLKNLNSSNRQIHVNCCLISIHFLDKDEV